MKTKRLYIRNFQKGDVEVLYKYRNDEKCSQYQRYDDTSKSYLSAFTEKYKNSTFPSTDNEQHYAIVHSETNVMIGDFSIFFSNKDDCFTLGITISPKYQNNGYAYELLTEVINTLHSRYPTTELVALIEKENEKCLNLFKKLGFVEECYSEKLESCVFVKNNWL